MKMQKLADAYYDARLGHWLANDYLRSTDNMYRHAAADVAQAFLNDTCLSAEQAHDVWGRSAFEYIDDFPSPDMMRTFEQLAPSDRLRALGGLQAMRQKLHEIEWEEAEALTEWLHPDAQQQHDIDNGWAE